MEYDLLHVPKDIEKRTHKLKRLVQAPNSYFMKLKNKTSSNVTVVFSNAHGIIKDMKDNKIIAQSTGGKIKISSHCEFKPIVESKKRN